MLSFVHCNIGDPLFSCPLYFTGPLVEELLGWGRVQLDVSCQLYAATSSCEHQLFLDWGEVAAAYTQPVVRSLTSVTAYSPSGLVWSC